MTLFGPDGSYWQFKPKSSRDLAMTDDDWGRISFVIWRSSIGFRTDWSFAQMRDAATVRLKPFAAYHWVYPTGKYSAQGQAEAMAKMNPDRTIPVMLDWETESGLYPTIDDCDKVADAMRALGYRVPLLYTGTWYWSLPQVGSPRLSGRGYDLVLSDYNKNTSAAVLPAYNAWGGDTAGEWRRELGGLSPVFCQFGSKVAFGGLNMDMNAFRGTYNELGRWFKTWDQVAGDSSADTEDDDMPLSDADKAWITKTVNAAVRAVWATPIRYAKQETGGGESAAVEPASAVLSAAASYAGRAAEAPKPGGDKPSAS